MRWLILATFGWVLGCVIMAWAGFGTLGDGEGFGGGFVNPSSLGGIPFTKSGGGGAPAPSIDFTKSMVMDGVDEHVVLPTGSAITSGLSTDISVFAWVKTSSVASPAAEIVGHWGAAGSRKFLLRILSTAGKLEYLLTGDGTTLDQRGEHTAINLIDSAWHHIGWTYDASQAGTTEFDLYIDGSGVGRTTSATNDTTTAFNAGGNVLLGAQNSVTPANFLNGNLHGVSMWNKVLTSGEVSELYNSGTPFDLNTHSAAANLVGWWVAGNGTFPTIDDQSSNSNDGTLTNMEAGDIVTDAP